MSTLLGWLKSAAASVRESPMDAALTAAMVIALKCVLDAGQTMPKLPRILQLIIASLLMAIGGYLFTCSSMALPSAGMLLPGSDPRRKPLTSGHHVYGICRHPQFSGLLALCLSMCLLSQSADRLFYTLVLMVVLDKKADLEEHAMVHDHPEYARYLLQVPKFMPNLAVLVGLGGGTSAAEGMAGAPSSASDDENASLLRAEQRNSNGGGATPRKLPPDTRCYRSVMLKLPDDRLEPPICEPSQQICPHWMLVVAHQGVREVLYMTLETGRKTKKCLSCSSSVSPGDAIYYVSISGNSPMKSLMATKRVLFVRHGQGAHNRTIKNWGMIDPELDAVGEAQAAELNKQLQPYLSEVQLVVTSPLTRAMQTATGGFAGCKAPFMLQPIFRERLGAPCDTGRTKAELARCFPQLAKWEGFDEMPEVWWSTATEYDLLERVDLVKAWIQARPEQVIAVVGHGGLWQRILGYHLKNCGFQWVQWGGLASDM